MKKPIVFLSHSAKNKAQVVALKSLLNDKASGFIEFFLSCDGESIRLGTNWVRRLDEALKNARLMFVLVSKESLQSTWVPFEAGYSYGRNIDVVPCCLPGVQLRDLPPPLNLLQAQTIHSALDLSRLLHKCNEVLHASISSDITQTEFSTIFKPDSNVSEATASYVGGVAIKEIHIMLFGPPGGLDTLLRMCRRRHIDCYPAPPYGSNRKRLHASGIDIDEEEEWYNNGNEIVKGGDSRRYFITLSPELRDVTLPLVDAWRKKHKANKFPEVVVYFHPDLDLEAESHRFTTKLFSSGISIIADNFLHYKKMNFSIRDRHSVHQPILRFTCCGKLADEPIDELLSILIKREVLIVPKKSTDQLVKRIRHGANY